MANDNNVPTASSDPSDSATQDFSAATSGNSASNAASGPDGYSGGDEDSFEATLNSYADPLDGNLLPNTGGLNSDGFSSGSTGGGLDSIGLNSGAPGDNGLNDGVPNATPSDLSLSPPGDVEGLLRDPYLRLLDFAGQRRLVAGVMGDPSVAQPLQPPPVPFHFSADAKRQHLGPNAEGLSDGAIHEIYHLKYGSVPDDDDSHVVNALIDRAYGPGADPFGTRYLLGGKPTPAVEAAGAQQNPGTVLSDDAGQTVNFKGDGQNGGNPLLQEVAQHQKQIGNRQNPESIKDRVNAPRKPARFDDPVVNTIFHETAGFRGNPENLHRMRLYGAHVYANTKGKGFPNSERTMSSKDIKLINEIASARNFDKLSDEQKAIYTAYMDAIDAADEARKARQNPDLSKRDPTGGATHWFFYDPQKPYLSIPDTETVTVRNPKTGKMEAKQKEVFYDPIWDGEHHEWKRIRNKDGTIALDANGSPLGYVKDTRKGHKHDRPSWTTQVDAGPIVGQVTNKAGHGDVPTGDQVYTIVGKDHDRSSDDNFMAPPITAGQKKGSPNARTHRRGGKRGQ